MFWNANLMAALCGCWQYETKPMTLPKITARSQDRGEILLYGPIGQDWFGEGNSAKQFAEDLRKLNNAKNIDVRINSEGGDVFTGKAMYTLLTTLKANVTVHIDGLAASAASFIAMAGNEIKISESAFVMIHDAYGVSVGRSEDHIAFAKLLDATNDGIVDVYAARTGQDKEKIKKWMKDETWFTAKDAIANGFATSMVENLKVAARLENPSAFKNLPSVLLPKRAAATAQIAALKRK